MYTFFLSHTPEEIDMLYPSEAMDRLKSLGRIMTNPYDRQLSQDEIIELAKEAHFLITTVRVEGSRKLFDHLPHLIAFIRSGVDIRNIDLEAASAKGVLVCNCPGIYEAPVVELVIGYLCCISRGIIEHNGDLRKGIVRRYTRPDLWGTKLGLIGYGAIARKVAQAVKPLGMNVVVYDPFVKQVADDEQLVDLTELLSASDFVSLHAVLNDETIGMIGEKELSLMKSTAWLINSGRGLLIQEDVLYDFLVQKKIAGAALDVFATEPNIAGNRLIQLDNVIATPHIGGWSTRVYRELALYTVELIRMMMNGEIPASVVNQKDARRLLHD